MVSISENSPRPFPSKRAQTSATRICALLRIRTRLPANVAPSRKQGKWSTTSWTKAWAFPLQDFTQFTKDPSKVESRTSATSRNEISKSSFSLFLRIRTGDKEHYHAKLLICPWSLGRARCYRPSVGCWVSLQWHLWRILDWSSRRLCLQIGLLPRKKPSSRCTALPA